MAPKPFDPPTDTIVLRLPSTRNKKPLSHRGSESVQSVSVIPLSDSRRTRLVLERLQTIEAICLRSPEQETQWRLPGRASDRLLLYVADGRRSAWARHCISQATRTVFLADADSNAVERGAMAFAGEMRHNASLVLVHGANASTPATQPEWLRHFQDGQILHIRSESRVDLESALRLVTHRAMCVVFSGGGARALAHVGALLAFEEKGLAIDAVGGASMGGLVAALVAQGRSAGEVLEGMRRHLVDSNPICDYTFPLVSLVRGRRLAGAFTDVFGEATIENLWKPFFCVSTDLASHSLVVHRSGPVSLALRASTAIPGLLPPVTDDGRVLVDGCIMDSLPTTVMRAMHRGPIVGIDVSANFVIAAKDLDVENRPWFWPFRGGASNLPPLARILMSCAAASAGAHLSASRAAADLLIEPNVAGINLLSFKAFDKAVEAGYQAAIEAIPRLEASRAAALPTIGVAA